MTEYYDVFLSHNSRDKNYVEMLARRLSQEHKIRPFLDKWHLIPGQPWQEAIENALKNSKTVAVFIGSSGISPWHNEEMRNAINHSVRTRDDFRVIPVLLPDSKEEDISDFLARRTWVDFRKGIADPEAFNRLISGIKGKVRTDEAFEISTNIEPYRGLLPFDATQSEYFFGRETDIQKTLIKLAKSNFLAIIGASGVGKSSLIRAGVIPRLKDRYSEAWIYLIMSPGSDAIRSLTDQIASFFPLADRIKISDLIYERILARNDGLRTALNTLISQDRNKRILLFIDQFEEIFTLSTKNPTDKNHTRQFIQNLFDFAASGNRLHQTIITVRADFLNNCIEHDELRELLEDNQVLLSMMNSQSLREAIVQPAQKAGGLFEDGLVRVILSDVSNQPGILPLLQHALVELWHARKGPWLTFETYDAIDGVAGALHKRANMTLDELDLNQKKIAKNIFIRLTSLGEDSAFTKRRVPKSELYPAGVEPYQVDFVISKLSGPESRLIVADKKTVEISHEILLAKWEVLKGWLEDERETLRIGRHLTKSSNDWIASGKDQGELYRGKRLQQAYQWSNNHWDDLTANEQKFLEESIRLNIKEKTDQRRTEIINRISYKINGSLKFEELIGAAIDTSMEIMEDIGSPTNQSVCIFALLRDEKLSIASARNITPLDLHIPILNNGMVGEAIRSGKPQLLIHPSSDPNLDKMIAFRNCNSIYCYPLNTEYLKFGALVFGNPQSNYFNESQRELLDILGRQIAFAMHNFQLRSEVKDDKERMAEIHEEVRKKLARDLHDGPTQSVAALALRANMIRRMLTKDPSAASDELVKLEELAHRTTKEIRHMLFTLRPLILESQGLYAALQAMADKLQETFLQKLSIVIDLDQHVLNNLEMGKQGVIFYIVEEAVNNSRKHASAENIWVRLKSYRNMYSLLEIEDNGVGFDLSEFPSDTLGFINLRERAELISGRLEIQSSVGKGTKIRVWIPMNEDAVDHLKHEGPPID